MAAKGRTVRPIGQPHPGANRATRRATTNGTGTPATIDNGRRPQHTPQPPELLRQGIEEVTAPPWDVPVQRDQVYGRQGVDVVLAAGTPSEWHGHTAIYNAEGIAAVQLYLHKKYPQGALFEGESVGRMILEGAMMTGNYAALHGLMQWVLLEPVTIETVMRAYPDEMVAAINAFYSQSGMEWLERMVKNSASRVGKIWLAQADLLAEATAKLVEQFLDQAREGIVDQEVARILKEAIADFAAQKSEPDGTLAATSTST